MEVDFVPDHLVIVGGSYIGLEFGQKYRRFGSEVTVVEMGRRLIGREDEDVSQAVREIMEAEGIQIRLNAKSISLAKRDKGVAVHVTSAKLIKGVKEIFYPGLPHGLTATHADQVNADLLKFLKSVQQVRKAA